MKPVDLPPPVGPADLVKPLSVWAAHFLGESCSRFLKRFRHPQETSVHGVAYDLIWDTVERRGQVGSNGTVCYGYLFEAAVDLLRGVKEELG